MSGYRRHMVVAGCYVVVYLGMSVAILMVGARVAMMRPEHVTIPRFQPRKGVHGND